MAGCTRSVFEGKGSTQAQLDALLADECYTMDRIVVTPISSDNGIAFNPKSIVMFGWVPAKDSGPNSGEIESGLRATTVATPKWAGVHTIQYQIGGFSSCSCRPVPCGGGCDYTGESMAACITGSHTATRDVTVQASPQQWEQRALRARVF